jgi:hypothetical protein
MVATLALLPTGNRAVQHQKPVLLGLPMPRRSHTPSLFGPDEFTIRSPRRIREGVVCYVAQVWTARGFWTVGAFPSRVEARRAARVFAGTDPVEPVAGTPRAELPSNWRWKRSDGHAPRYKWVRRVKGGAWQARPWLGAAHGSLNLGLFTIDEHGDADTAEWAAAQVAAAFNREWQGSRTVGEVVASLRALPVNHRERLAKDVTVPAHQRDLVRAEEGTEGPYESPAREQAQARAAWLSVNLFDEPVTADEVLAARHLSRRRRALARAEYAGVAEYIAACRAFAEYASEFREAIVEDGETFEDVVELLAA